VLYATKKCDIKTYIYISKAIPVTGLGGL
jgi:hypothetical protein